jgi:hypothetical protein
MRTKSLVGVGMLAIAPSSFGAEVGKPWSLNAKCIVQQQGNVFALFTDDPEHITELKVGDTLDITASACPEYKGFLTAAKVRVTGMMHDGEASGPRFRYYIVGAPQ